MKGMILMDRKGKIYERAVDGVLMGRVEMPEFSRDPYQHFFKRPFRAAVYVVEKQIVGSVSIHPTSFYPSSPFDTFRAMEAYAKDNALLIPKFYLYPNGTCNARCPICQFQSLNRFGKRPRKERYLSLALARQIIGEMVNLGEGLHSQSVNVSGDGEPSQHPQFAQIMHDLKDKGRRIFLSSNMIFSPDTASEKISTITQTVDILTASIKGLDAIAYDHYQGRNGGKTFQVVLANLEETVQQLKYYGRREDVLVGVATIIAPENTDCYEEALHRFIDMGIDYVYFNPIEPSYAAWGISFTPYQQDRTKEFLTNLAYKNCGNTLVRYPGTIHLNRPQEKVYYDASARKHPTICGSALWSPTIITTDTPGKAGARIVSCRSSANFTNPAFWFADGIQDTSSFDSILKQRSSEVMRATARCTDCRLERQVTLFDRLLALMEQHAYQGQFYLEFDGVTRRSGRAIPFEETK